MLNANQNRSNIFVELSNCDKQGGHGFLSTAWCTWTILLLPTAFQAHATCTLTHLKHFMFILRSTLLSLFCSPVAFC